MIHMISGFTSFGGRTIGPKDGKITLDENAEARLVALGVAEYATAPQAAPAAGFGAGQGADPAPAENGAEAATEGVEALNEPGKINLPEGRLPILAVEDGTELMMQGEPDESGVILPAIGIEDMSFAQLKTVAEQMGLETKGLRSKAALISAIENAKPPNPKVME